MILGRTSDQSNIIILLSSALGHVKNFNLMGFLRLVKNTFKDSVTQTQVTLVTSSSIILNS